MGLRTIQELRREAFPVCSVLCAAIRTNLTHDCADACGHKFRKVVGTPYECEHLTQIELDSHLAKVKT